MNKLIVIVGPTGIGKTVLATKLASSLSGEIVNADSRQIYRYMDIGTAKPDPETMTAVKHHLIDIIEPDREFSLAEYQKLLCCYPGYPCTRQTAVSGRWQWTLYLGSTRGLGYS